jgi:hypothetical protein
MRKRTKGIFFLMIVVCLTTVTKAIAQKTKTPQQIMASIYTAYDSLPSLSFDVKYKYTSDTLKGDFTNESMQGSYTMSGKKSLYNIGHIQFMQNDSFYIAVYNDEKFILITDPHTTSAESSLPLHTFMDSILHSYASHYTISNKRINDTTNSISFTRIDSAAQFDEFTITYLNKKRAFLQSISYSFKKAEWFEDSSAIAQTGKVIQQQVNRRQNLTIDFFNYRVDKFSKKLYDESNYVWFDNGTWRPADKYKEYKIYYSRADAARK